MSTQPVSVAGGPAPLVYDVPATQLVTPLLASAVFDGSGAGQDFLPCMTFYGPGGTLLGRFGVENTLHAGDVAEVTYSPFSRTPAGAAPGATMIVYHNGV